MDTTEKAFAHEANVKIDDAKADAAKAEAAANLAATSYLDKEKYAAAEAKNEAAIKAKEAALLARYLAIDDSTAKDFISSYKKNRFRILYDKK